MFYAAGEHQAHGLPHDPFKALVAPRPIGWISAVSRDGAVNLSPYSFFNAFSGRPPIVGFSSEGAKDAVTFVAETGEFVCNIASLEFADRLSLTSAPLPRGTSEFAHAGLEMEPSRLVRPPRVRGIAAALECRVLQILEPLDLAGAPAGCRLVLGQVVGFYIDERCIRDGRADITRIRPLARCGYADYAVVEHVFPLVRPAGG
ncbi:MAG TPA: flavin reductase family protein [Geminicoccaceae bacterium]|nr:flavin reductase family protein [Geminicoccaceae bacterium]